MERHEKEALKALMVLPVVDRARAFCYIAHQAVGQKHADKETPYYTHPFEVARYMHLFGATQLECAVGYLHDVIEDTHFEANELAKYFGPAVAGMVVEVSNIATKETHPESTRLERRTLNVQFFTQGREGSRLAKLCDALHNLKGLEALSEKFQKVYVEELRYQVAELLKCHYSARIKIRELKTYLDVAFEDADRLIASRTAA